MKDGAIVAVVWSVDGKITTFGVKNRPLFPSKINNAGSVVGHYFDRGKVVSAHAFLWAGRKLRDLGDFEPLGINDAGEAVGRQVSNANNKLRIEPVLCRPGKRLTLLPKLRGFEFGVASDINGSGHCCGSVTGGDRRARAVVWENGKARSLSDKPSVAYDMNDAGLVAGAALRDSSSEAVIWDGKREVFLGDSLPRRSGWRLLSAVGVNERGQIAGTGTKAGAYCGFILTPKK